MSAEPNGSSEWVVDASVVAKWYLKDEEFVEQADRLLDRYLAGTVVLITPHFTRYELANAVTRAARRGRVTEEEASAALLDFSKLGLAQDVDKDECLASSLQIAARLGVSFYDALYLALADELRVGFVTADVPLFSRASDDMPSVSFLRDVAPDLP